MATPSTIVRVNARLLPHFTSRTVRVIGRVTSVGPSGVLLAATDNAPVVIIPASSSSAATFPVGKVIEVLGHVTLDHKLQEEHHVIFEGTLDAKTYETLLKLQHERFAALCLN